VLKIKEKGHDFLPPDHRCAAGYGRTFRRYAVGGGKLGEGRPGGSSLTLLWAYLDSTVAMPILTSYVLTKRRPRKLKRLYDRRKEMVDVLRREYVKNIATQMKMRPS